MPLTPAQRAIRSRIAAFAMHAGHDARETTAPGRAAFLATFARRVDPAGDLPDAERLRRAEAARKAHFARLALASSKARGNRRGRGQRTRAPGVLGISRTSGEKP